MNATVLALRASTRTVQVDGEYSRTPQPPVLRPLPTAPRVSRLLADAAPPGPGLSIPFEPARLTPPLIPF